MNKMNIKKNVFLLFLLAIQVTFSQSKITGKIVDSENLSIEGANIILTKKAKKLNGLISDSEGNFSIEANASGTYSMRITYLGFAPFIKSITIVDNKNINLGTIILQESSELLQSIEVVGRIRKDYNSDYSFSATKIAIKNKELPQAVATSTNI